MDLPERVTQLEAENAALRQLIATLEGPASSSWSPAWARTHATPPLPPSTDSQARPKPAKRVKRQRRPGKQPGAPDAHLQRVADPDHMVDHAPKECRDCGADLASAPVVGVESRQVFDLPERRAEVTDHRASAGAARAGCVTAAQFPSGATAAACWGRPGCGPQRSIRWCAITSRGQGGRARVHGVAGGAHGRGGRGPWSRSWRTSGNRLADEPVAHADETGCRVAGAKQWFHVVCTALLSYLAAHVKRGNATTDDMGVLARFGGVLVHDLGALLDLQAYPPRRVQRPRTSNAPSGAARHHRPRHRRRPQGGRRSIALPTLFPVGRSLSTVAPNPPRLMAGPPWSGEPAPAREGSRTDTPTLAR